MRNKGKRVLIIDNYRLKNKEKYEEPKGIQEIRAAIESTGGYVDIIHHSKAQEKVKNGEDILKGYDSVHVSGSDISWKEKTDKGGRGYMHPGSNVLHEYLVSHKKPVKFECGGAHAAATAIGYKVRNTGKFNRGTREDGHMYNHKYGIEKQDLDDRVTNVETVTHEGKEYVASLDYGNKRIVQYHPGRTEKGREEIKKFHKLAA